MAEHTVILTHEHTDFDALASMLAAAKLYPHALPVLPRLLNRNLEAFLSEYQDGLPFVRGDELPRRRVDHAILVDTQALHPVRGMQPGTQVHCIDHHPPGRDLPEQWTAWGEETGATTTLLVEQLAAQEMSITPVEATLLTLGIYEDTGGLTYATTTPRDLRAAAWLLDRGASLREVDKYLHHPLTEAQLSLYQSLAENSQPFDIHGHSVIIASATIVESIEEISTLTHKLRDLYEPDGLFVLVDMGDRIQLVARSSSDAIDAGRIAAAFGGGGHGRAAAAMVREGTLASVYESLVYALQSQVRPTVTVGQIMSYGVPQTLAPDDTIASAAERMRRYGFEGFPVVHAGRIVGMLTRRELDRAVHHGLERHSVSRYMRSGEVYVVPGDSVGTLRRVMSESDWGQVPVLEPETGSIVGIVTRTDLIKQWSAPPPAPAEDLDALMVRALPGPLYDLLRRAGEAAGAQGHPLYAVGGFARDLLLGRPNADVDLVVEGDAIDLAHALSNQFGGRVRSHRRFGTAKWILPAEVAPGASFEASGEDRDPAGEMPASLDFVTARTEFYEHPTALPTVERSSIKQDLHRRDFTINTLAVSLEPGRWGELLDFYGGRKDLDTGLIRVLHSLSFVEDPTRILRAARFEQRFGFRIEHRTEVLIADALDLLERVSPERVRHELESILAEPEPELVFARLDALGVLRRLSPELRSDPWLRTSSIELRARLAARRMPAHREEGASLGPDAAPRLALALLTSRMSREAEQLFLDRFRFKKAYLDTAAALRWLRERVDILSNPGLKPSAAAALLDESGAEARLLLGVISEDEIVRRWLDTYESRLRQLRPALTGADLRGAGLQPGVAYRDTLARLRAARADGEVATEMEEWQLLRRLLAEDRLGGADAASDGSRRRKPDAG